uniref:Uncharacterized protein n=1 Tax=viral metagenome TaxID=1070528 RepID=A0A6C0CAS7_9ZZZZ
MAESAIEICEKYHLSNFGKRMSGCSLCDGPHNLINCAYRAPNDENLCSCGENKFINADKHIDCEKKVKPL